MADNKFGLPEALINAVRQVAETSALLPRDDRERDLERQAALKPESLDEVRQKPSRRGMVWSTPHGTNRSNTPTPKQLARKKKEAEHLAAIKAAGGKGFKEQIEVGNTSEVYFYEKLSGNQHVIAVDEALEFKPVRVSVGPYVGNEQNHGGGHHVIAHGPNGEKKNVTQFPVGIDSARETAADTAKTHGLKPDKSKPYGHFIPEESELDEGKFGNALKRGMERYKGKSKSPLISAGIHAIQNTQAALAAKKSKADPDNFDKLMNYANARNKVREETELDEGDTGWRPMSPETQRRIKKLRNVAGHLANRGKKEVEKSDEKSETSSVKEETELDEALTPAQRKALQKRREAMRGTKAAPKPKKAVAHVEPDVEKNEPKRGHESENETPSGEKETHIVMAARKAVSLGEYPFTFENGKTHIIDKNTGRRIIAVHGNQKDKSEFESRLRSSHEDMMSALKNPDNAPPKPKGKFALVTLKDRPNFMGDLDRLSKAYREKQAAKKKG